VEKTRKERRQADSVYRKMECMYDSVRIRNCLLIIRIEKETKKHCILFIFALGNNHD
jgi:hypothetical protein